MDDQGQLGGQNAMFVFSHTKDVPALLRILTKLPLKISFPRSEIPGWPNLPSILQSKKSCSRYLSARIAFSGTIYIMLENSLKQLWLALSPFVVLLLSRCRIFRSKVVLYSFIINSQKRLTCNVSRYIHTVYIIW